MSRPLEKQALPKRLLWNVPVSALGAWGMAEIYFAALPCGSVPPVLLPLVCLGLCLALGLIDGLLHKRGKVIALFTLAALEGALFFFGRGFAYGLYQGVRSMMLGFSGVTGAMLPYGAELALMLSLVFSLMLYTLVRDNLFPLALGCMLPVLAAGVYLTGGETFIYAVPVMFSLLSMLSGMNGKRLTAVLLAAILILNISLFYRDIIRYDISYYNLGVVTKISARSKGSDEILLKLNYLLPSGGYSVCNVDENDGEYIGDGEIEYDGSMGKYRIMVKFGDVGMSYKTLTEFLAHDSLKELPIEIKAKQA